MKYLFYIIFIHVSGISLGQSIYVEGGLLLFKNKVVTPLIHQISTYSQDEYMMVGYEHHLPKFYNLFISLDYSYYYNGPEFSMDPDTKNPNLGCGFGTTFNEGHVFAIGTRIPKEFMNRVTISGGLYFKAIKVINTWYNEYNIPETRLREGYIGLYSSVVYEGWKYQPEIRLALDIRFLRRMHFYTNWGFSLGFSKWQDLTYNYSYNGMKEPTAEIYVDGTGYFANIGIKFDFVSQKK